VSPLLRYYALSVLGIIFCIYFLYEEPIPKHPIAEHYFPHPTSILALLAVVLCLGSARLLVRCPKCKKLLSARSSRWGMRGLPGRRCELCGHDLSKSS
jgi:hypothetical protein